MNENVELLEPEKLLLDRANPRFGALDDKRVNQKEILDFIVTNFGVDDLLSSLAVNGYFAAEPLVCTSIEDSDEFVVAEGNRRLAACLILLGDARASNHDQRAARYREIHQANGSPSIKPLPAIIFPIGTDKGDILSYLGVRHIASAQQWDSYAKAVWIARVVDETSLSTNHIAEMIGDQHRTVARLLEGYNFIRQLEETGRFYPENSVRRGRGSNTTYPFSWVYTILGFKPMRDFLELDEDRAARHPIPEEKLDAAALVTTAMFGDNSQGRSSSLEDSRQLTALASAVASPDKVELLKDGKKLNEIERETQPLDERLSEGLRIAQEELSALNNRLSTDPPTLATAERHTDRSTRVRRLAGSVEKQLVESLKPDND